jgi:hypothetical protein
MRRPLSLAAVIVMSLQVAACAGAAVQSGVRPAWVDSSTARDSQWGRQQYVTAVGSGTSRVAAEAAAKRSVAETLRMDVRSSLTRETKSNF